MATILNQTPLCRCCHKNGVFKSLFSDYIYENEVENYSQILHATFGILVEPSERDKTYTICDECIEKLRISMDFKIACGKIMKQEPLIENNVPIKKKKFLSYVCSDKEMHRTKATATQIHYLVEYMKKNPKFAAGRANGLQEKVEFEKQWKHLVSTLNSLGGPVKSEEKWKQTWRDLRNTIKKKALKNKKKLKGDGPGCTSNEQAQLEVFTARDEAVMATMPIFPSVSVTVPTDHVMSVLSTTPPLPPPSPPPSPPSPAAHTAPNRPQTRTSHRRRLTSRTEFFDTKIMDFEKEHLEIQKKQLLLNEAKVKAFERIAAALEEHNRLINK